MKRFPAFALSLFVVFSMYRAPAAEASPAKKDPLSAFHFEAANAWAVPDWSDPLEPLRVEDDATQGKSALRLTAKQPKAGKAAVETKLPNLDLKQYDAITLDVKLKAGKNYPALLTLALLTGQNGAWIESKPVQLKEGWNKDIRFDIGTSNWKSRASGWRYRVSPRAGGPVWSLVLLVHGLDHGEAVVLDHLRLTPSTSKTKKIRPTERETLDLTRADRIRANTLNILAEYAADLRLQKQDQEAEAVEALIKTAAAAPLQGRETPLRPLQIVINREGAIRIDGRPVPAEKTGTVFAALTRKERLLLIKPDPAAPFRTVSAVLEAGRKAGFVNIKVEKAPEKEKAPAGEKE